MLKFIMYLIFLIPLFLKNIWMFSIYFLFFFFFFFFFFFYNFFGLYINCSYNFFMDNISFMFCCLTIWICLLVLICSIDYYFYYLNSFYFFILIYFLMIFLFIDFIVYDFFMFYFFFECSLIPIFLIIFGWGYQPERLSAGFYLIFYTLFGSLPLLLIIFFLINMNGGFIFFINIFLKNYFLVFFIMISFLIKFPLFGFHLWLPKAHVEAPVSGSMILAGLMLKLGGYGLIRCLPFIYEFLFLYGYFLISLSLIGCLFSSLFCLIQSDLKMLIAYSSVCHMGLVICGTCTFTDFGVLGSLMMMISHGFVSSGLFYLVGLVYDRLGTRSFFILKGLLSLSPSLGLFWFFFCAMNMSCPPSLNLFSEICLMISILSWSTLSMMFFFFIFFFSACYSMMIFSFTQHGNFSTNLFFYKYFFVREFLVLYLHLIPVFGLMFNIGFFF
uniref:NADH dehydrogenase subunit 4 n=1 Tax=Raivuna sinica TaxID=2992948 RepID=UPI002551EA1E|nr:NADH dehydrogenase subunit 4 [Raivuna sinica]WGG26906.1 NADH dehydrogenase subunit 4 [Raivuna sinica]